MSFKEILNSYANIGAKVDHKPWEVSLIRKLNVHSLFGTMNVIFALLIFLIFDYNRQRSCLRIFLYCCFVRQEFPNLPKTRELKQNH